MGVLPATYLGLPLGAPYKSFRLYLVLRKFEEKYERKKIERKEKVKESKKYI